MSRKILIRSYEGRRHIATWSGDRLAAYDVIDTSRVDRTGGIYLARVRAVDTSLGAAFVEFASGEEGLLPLRSGGKIAEGSSLLVQLRRDKQGPKAARLADRITLTERDLHLRVDRPGVETYPQMKRTAPIEEACKTVEALLPKGHGALLRPSIEEAAATRVESQVRHLLDAWATISKEGLIGEPPRLLRPADDALAQLLRDLPEEGAEIVCADRTTAHLVAKRLEGSGHVPPAIAVLPESQWIPSVAELDETLEEILSQEVELRGGGSLLIEPGKTLVAIDVNSGDFSARGGNRARSDQVRLTLNKIAAAEIALQLRVRNLSGPIVIDFISMRRRSEQDEIVDALRAACCADPQPCEILPMSRFGLVEMVRQGKGPTLAERLRSAP